jgi:AcrR family transcriptional regulator
MSLPEKSQAAMRDQITNATLSLLLTEGLEATNLKQIADEASISMQELRAYFNDRREIIIAALDCISNRLVEKVSSAEEDIVLLMLLTRAAMTDAMVLHHEDPWDQFESICTAMSEKMREAFQQKLNKDIDTLDGLLHLKDQGPSQNHFDGKFPAWEVISIGFALCFANLLGYGDIFAQGKLRQAIESIINDKSLPGGDISHAEANPTS